MAAQKKDPPKYLFDLYGVRSVLKSDSNQARDAFISGLASGSVKVMSEVASQLKAIDEDLYKEFQAIKSGKVYQPTTIAHSSAQQALMDKFGTGLFGGSPSPEYFESVAVCKVDNLILVTADKALKNCKAITKKCNLASVTVLSIAEFGAEA